MQEADINDSGVSWCMKVGSCAEDVEVGGETCPERFMPGLEVMRLRRYTSSALWFLALLSAEPVDDER